LKPPVKPLGRRENTSPDKSRHWPSARQLAALR
jgi:hypothetical protein